jgi:hypothetical protein
MQDESVSQAESELSRVAIDTAERPQETSQTNTPTNGRGDGASIADGSTPVLATTDATGADGRIGANRNGARTGTGTLTGGVSAPDLLDAIAQTMREAAQRERDRIERELASRLDAYRAGIQGRASHEAQELIRLAEEDVEQIRAASEAVIERVMADTNRRIEARRADLETHLSHRDAEVERELAAAANVIDTYRAELERFIHGLADVSDPTEIARLARDVPRPPRLDDIQAIVAAKAIEAREPIAASPEPIAALPKPIDTPPEPIATPPEPTSGPEPTPAPEATTVSREATTVTPEATTVTPEPTIDAGETAPEGPHTQPSPPPTSSIQAPRAETGLIGVMDRSAIGRKAAWTGQLVGATRATPSTPQPPITPAYVPMPRRQLARTMPIDDVGAYLDARGSATASTHTVGPPPASTIAARRGQASHDARTVGLHVVVGGEPEPQTPAVTDADEMPDWTDVVLRYVPFVLLVVIGAVALYLILTGQATAATPR